MSDVIVVPLAPEVVVLADAAVTVVDRGEATEIIETPTPIHTVGTVVPVIETISNDAPVEVVSVNMGLPGPPGPRGPAGPSGGEAYVYVQSIAAPLWEIGHGLDRYPSVTVADQSGDKIEAHVTYIDAGNVRLTFSEPIVDTAYLN